MPGCSFSSSLVFLHVKISVKIVREFLGNVTSFFWSTFVLRGGNVTFHGIRVPGEMHLSLMSVLYLWVTLGCDVFGCHGNLVWDVRGFPGASSTESVANEGVGA